MQARRCITSAVVFALSSALPAIASPLAATTSATTRTHAASAAQSAASKPAFTQARSQAAGRTPIEQNTIKQNVIEQHTDRQNMIRQHGLRQFGHEQASINSNGRVAVDRDFGRDHAADRHELNDARRMHRAERWARDRDDMATNRHDGDRFSGHWHNYARSDRDHDRWASRNVNSNGRYALDRDFGRDRAADRHALNDARRTDRTGSAISSLSAAAKSTRWQTADRDYAMERAIGRTDAGARAAQTGERTAGRFEWAHQLASRTGDRATSLAEVSRQPEHATPHFVNAMGGARASADRDDVATEK